VQADLTLLRTWRRRLVESGFHDIEAPDGSLKPPLRPFGDSRRDFFRCHPIEREGIAGYYHRAETFTATHRFGKFSKQTKAVWRLHAQGLSNQEVSKRLGVTLIVVRSAIRRVRLAAGLPEVTSTIGHGR
jgi:hypothetical protein